MDLEMVLNELSLQTPAPDIPTARERMSELIKTLRRATASGVKRILRTNSNINSLELAPGYPVARWRNDPESDREETRFFRTLTAKAPFWEDAAKEIKEQFELSEVFYQGEQAMGLTFAFVSDALAVSLLSESKWDCSWIKNRTRARDGSELWQLFSWHVRMTPGPWRLHFSVKLGPGRIIVGYIGRKIQ